MQIKYRVATFIELAVCDAVCIYRSKHTNANNLSNQIKYRSIDADVGCRPPRRAITNQTHSSRTDIKWCIFYFSCLPQLTERHSHTDVHFRCTFTPFKSANSHLHNTVTIIR